MIITGVGATGVGVSAALTAALTARGLRQLGIDGLGRRPSISLAAVVGGFVGGVVLLAAHHSGEWNLLPGFGLWACVLVAAGLCDALTRRIPTALVRPGSIAVAVLFAVGFTATHDWRGLILSGVASVAGAATMLVCWRYLEVGFGDVRVALLGGLGLGNADPFSLCIGFIIFATVVSGQLTAQRLRGGDNRRQIALGPALAAGFILAATL